MKKTLCAVLIAALLISVFALAENVPEAAPETTEQKLEAMIPVLDSLAMTLGIGAEAVEGEEKPVYDALDEQLVWKQLRQMGAEWLSRGTVDETAEEVSIPAEVMDAAAAAAFSTLQMAPVLRETEDDSVIYDAANDAYIVALGEDDGHYTVVESYAEDGDELVVNCGLYEGETERRKGGMTARMAPVQEEEAAWPYAVTDAHSEARDDFDGLWATLTDIRYVEPEPTPEPTVEPTPSPTPTPRPTVKPASRSGYSGSSGSSYTDYKRLEQGDKGSEVKALQKRLNKLGYDCGSADGKFGDNTYEAVRYFQDAIGADQDGVATIELQKKLFASDAPEFVTYVPLKKGDKGIRVEKLQSRLNSLGYTAHPANGSYDGRIEDAVKLFQEFNDILPEDSYGKADVTTLKALAKSSAKSYMDNYIDLEKGDSGKRISQLQKRLKKLGYLDTVSSLYDSKTVKAIAALKADYGLSGDGQSVSAGDLAAIMTGNLQPTPTPEPTVTPEPSVSPEPSTSPEASVEPGTSDDPGKTEDGGKTDDPGKTEEGGKTDDPGKTEEGGKTEESGKTDEGEKTDEGSEKKQEEEKQEQTNENENKDESKEENKEKETQEKSEDSGEKEGASESKKEPESQPEPKPEPKPEPEPEPSGDGE